MGDGASQIDWNPTHGQAWSGNTDWNPLNSTLGQFGQGNFSEAARGALGGAERFIKDSARISKDIIAPVAGMRDIAGEITGETGIKKRAAKDEADRNAYDAQQRQIQAQAAQQQKASADATAKNQTYRDQQTQLSNSAGEADAFAKARAAARRAKGSEMFGGYNG